MNELKQHLHQLIENCNSDLLLNEAKEILETPSDIKDWWDELTEEDQNLLMESESQYENENYVSHSALMQQFQEWKKK